LPEREKKGRPFSIKKRRKLHGGGGKKKGRKWPVLSDNDPGKKKGQKKRKELEANP